MKSSSPYRDGQYLGRAEGSVTPFVAYFCNGMAEALAAVKSQAARAAQRTERDVSPLLRQLDPRQRAALTLFRRQRSATTEELAEHLGLGARTVLALCRRWIAEGFLELHDASKKSRSYRLTPRYEALVMGYEA